MTSTNTPSIERPTSRAHLRSTPEVGLALQRLPRRQFLGFSGGIGKNVAIDIPLSRTPTSMVLAALLGAVEPQAGDRVLQFGTGNGYMAAVLADLAETVQTIDLVKGRLERAEHLYRAMGLDNISLAHGDGRDGLAGEAPFDAILASTTLGSLPEALVDQLAVGGRLVWLESRGRERATVRRLRKTDDEETTEELLGIVDLKSRIGDLLRDFDVLSAPYLERAAQEADRAGQRLGEYLVNQGAIDEETLYRVLAAQRGIAYGSVGPLLRGATTEFFQEVPERYMRHNRVIPLKLSGESLLVATSNPDAPTGDLRAVLGVGQIDSYLVTPTSFRRMWHALQTGRVEEAVQQTVAEGSQAMADPAPEEDPDELVSPTDASNKYVRLFDSILFDAAAERASDIHFERYDDQVRVRFRVDGELHDVERYNLTPTELRGLTNVLKITAELDITERRLPQGGRFSRVIQGQAIDLRVQIQPSLYGEYSVIRMLPQDDDLLTIDELGFPPEIGDQFRRLVQNPNGLILVVGPTGSGKSTTLYSGLQILARDARKKVITVEDPIEYSIDGVQQTQTKPKIGFGFADAMRSFVRQDPDVILVGEIRDRETALEAIRASQTGHLVLSTLHSNDTVDAIQRLFDLEMHPNSIASELIAVFAQRLAKRICSACKTEVEPDPKILGELFPAGPPEEFTAYLGKGCTRCNDSGTRGRIAVVESLNVGPNLRRSIARQLPLDDLRAAAHKAGLSPMRHNAIRLVRQGKIPLEEIPRILSVEAMAPPEAEHPFA